MNALAKIVGSWLAAKKGPKGFKGFATFLALLSWGCASWRTYKKIQSKYEQKQKLGWRIGGSWWRGVAAGLAHNILPTF